MTAAPKPPPRERKTRKPLPRATGTSPRAISVRRAAEHPELLKSGSTIARPAQPSQIARSAAPKKRNPERKAKRFAHDYLNVERVEWVKARRCAWCVLRGKVRIPPESDNAHTESRGAGLKGHYSTITELCRRHHEQYDRHEKPFDTISARYVVGTFAERTCNAWLAYVAAQPTTTRERS